MGWHNACNTHQRKKLEASPNLLTTEPLPAIHALQNWHGVSRNASLRETPCRHILSRFKPSTFLLRPTNMAGEGSLTEGREMRGE
jgi:hypothetical protein